MSKLCQTKAALWSAYIGFSTPQLQEITEFIQQLVSIPSVESEQAIATCIAEKLSTIGFEPHLIRDPEHPSVICHYQVQLRGCEGDSVPTHEPITMLRTLTVIAPRLDYRYNRLFQIVNQLFQILTLIIFFFDYISHRLIGSPNNFQCAIYYWQYRHYIQESTHTP